MIARHRPPVCIVTACLAHIARCSAASGLFGGEQAICCGRCGQDTVWYDAFVEGRPLAICASHQALRWPPYLARWESARRRALHRGPISTPQRRQGPPTPPGRALAVRRRCHRGDFGRRLGGGLHGPSAAPRRPTATSTGRSSRHGHTPRCALRCVRGRAGWCRTGGGGPATPRERVAVVANGRVAVTSALILGPERNQGWRGARRGHADDVAAWFVSIGRLSPVPPVVECGHECRVDCRGLRLTSRLTAPILNGNSFTLSDDRAGGSSCH